MPACRPWNRYDDQNDNRNNNRNGNRYYSRHGSRSWHFPRRILHAHVCRMGMTIKPDIRQQALAWLVTSWSGEITATERTALEQWRKADSEHEQAWQQVQGLGHAMQEIPPALNPTLRSSPRKNLRRTVLRCLVGLSAAGVAAVAGVAVHESEPWQRMSADLRTAGNQRRDVTLPDGTLVSMNSATAIDMQFDAARRRLLLRAAAKSW